MSVDPLAGNAPGVSAYTYSFNNPIKYTDPDGRWPWPWSTEWILTSAQFFHITAQNNGISRTDKNYYPRLGRIFENTVVKSLIESKNNSKFYPQGSKRAVIPDIVGESVKNYMNKKNPMRIDKRITFPNAHFIDAKFTDNLKLEQVYNSQQIRGFIDVLSEMKGGYVNGVWNPNIKPSDYGGAALTFITPFGATIDPEILIYATAKNVKINQRFVEQDKDNPSNIRVNSLNFHLNIVPDKSSPDGTILPYVIKSSGKSVDVDWNQK